MSAKGKEFKVNVSTDRATAISSSAGSYPNVLYFPIDDDNVIIFNGSIYVSIDTINIDGAYLCT